MSRTRFRVNPYSIVAECQGTPCSKQARNLKFKKRQLTNCGRNFKLRQRDFKLGQRLQIGTRDFKSGQGLQIGLEQIRL